MRDVATPSRLRVTVNLKSFGRNVRRIRSFLHPRVQLLIAVKKNAYGHGLVPIGRAAERAGVDWLGVFSAEEGLQLRAARVRLPVLVFSITPSSLLGAAIRGGLTLTITDGASARAVDRAAAGVGAKANVHLKLDTGMGRLGFSPAAVLQNELPAMMRCRNIRLAGVYSHLASIDEDVEYSRRQLAALLEFVRNAPCQFSLAHLGASGSLPKPEFHLDMVRIGIAAYGGHHELHGFKPVLRVTAPVVQVKQVPAGTSISYGRAFRTRTRARIAVVVAGYGDGYPRALSNRGWVSIHGHRAPVVGRVCMDQFMIDLTRIRGVKPDDHAELLGPKVPVARLAEAAGTISYELLCSLGR